MDWHSELTRCAERAAALASEVRAGRMTAPEALVVLQLMVRKELSVTAALEPSARARQVIDRCRQSGRRLPVDEAQDSLEVWWPFSLTERLVLSVTSVEEWTVLLRLASERLLATRAEVQVGANA